MYRPYGPYRPRIEIKQDEEGWWGLVYLFDDPDEVPLLAGPCEDRESAEKRAYTLARDVVPSDL